MAVDSLISGAKGCEFQWALMVMHHRPVFADKKVTVYALCLYSACCLFHAKSCCLSVVKK